MPLTARCDGMESGIGSRRECVRWPDRAVVDRMYGPSPSVAILVVPACYIRVRPAGGGRVGYEVGVLHCG